MTDEREIEDIYRQAEAEERDRERAEREERRLQAELDRPLPEPQWHHFRSVHEMSAREYSLWIDAASRRSCRNTRRLLRRRQRRRSRRS